MNETQSMPLNRKLAEKIANQLDIAGYESAADYVRSDFMAVQINLVLGEPVCPGCGCRKDEAHRPKYPSTRATCQATAERWLESS